MSESPITKRNIFLPFYPSPSPIPLRCTHLLITATHLQNRQPIPILYILNPKKCLPDDVQLHLSVVFVLTTGKQTQSPSQYLADHNFYRMLTDH